MPPRLPALLTPLLLLLAACEPGSSGTAQTQGVQTQRMETSRPAQSAPARPSRDPQSGLRAIAPSALPREGQDVLRRIARGGPFRYSKDGTTFGNRERLLPRQNRGYYREYTVPTPGESDRGARRLVCGGQPVTSTAECYYTSDHYASFRRVLP